MATEMTRSLEKETMVDEVVIVRRNSIVRILQREGVVRKEYHSRYSAVAEAETYAVLKKLVSVIPGLRIPSVIQVDTSTNSIEVEYVAGKLLADGIRKSGSGVVSPLRERLALLMSSAYARGFSIDFDPANIIIAADTGDIVVIDPVCSPLDTRHFTASVFFWGMIKNFVVSGRIWEIVSFAREWRDLAALYLAQTGGEKAEFYRDIASYIDLVSSWNVNESQAEPALKRLFRLVVVAPLLSMVGVLFKGLARYRKG